MEAEKLLVKMAIEEEREEGKEGGEAAGHCKFKWPSQDNSKNAFKRKSVKEFRLWATDCAGRGKPSGERGRGDEGRQRLRQRNLSQRQTPNRNSVGARREQRTGQEMENATVDREKVRQGESQRERERARKRGLHSRLAFGKLNCFRFCSHFASLFAFAAPNK